METSGIVRVDGVIELPEHMVGFIDPETICVNVTPIGVYQNLFVQAVEYGSRVIIRNASGGAINAYYHIHAKAK